MTVRNVVEGTLALVMLLVLGLIGVQTYVLNSELTNVKGAMLTRHDLTEASKDWAAGKEADAGRGAITLAKNVMLANSDAAKEPSLAPQSSSASPIKSNEPGGNESLKMLSDELQKVKHELADVQAKLDANIESTNIARVDLGHIVEKDGTGAPIVSIRDLMQSSQFKTEFRNAVDQVLPRLPPSGTVRIVNRMGSSQYLEVDGVGHWIGPLSTLDVVVPAGEATTRLTGYEPTKYWRLDAGDNYFQSVIIDPQTVYTPTIYAW